VEVKLYQHEGELYVLAKSSGRQAREIAMRRKRLARLSRKLRAMRKTLPNRDQLLLRIGAAKKEAGRAFGFVKIQLPDKDQPVARSTFTFHTDKAKLRAAQQRDGHYLLRSNLTGEGPAVLWTRYVQLTQIESVFRSLKSELGIRPIYHQLEHRADAHVVIAFLAYCLQVTLKNRLLIHEPGLTPSSCSRRWRPFRWSKSGSRCSTDAGWCCRVTPSRNPIFRRCWSRSASRCPRNRRPASNPRSLRLLRTIQKGERKQRYELDSAGIEDAFRGCLR